MKKITGSSVFLIDIGDTLVHIGQPFEEYTRQAIRNIFPFFQCDDMNRFVEKVFEIRQAIRKQAHKTLKEYPFEFFIDKISTCFPLKEPVQYTVIEEYYIKAELEITEIFDDAFTFLAYLKSLGKIICAATNNFSPLHVHQLLEKFDLSPFFDYLFISGQMRIRKPHPDFFYHIEKHFPDKQKQEFVIIGDKPEMDIALAHKTGIKNIWLNRNRQKTDIIPTFEVQSLSEIKL